MVVTVAVVAGMQTFLAVAQLVREDAVGLDALGEEPLPFWEFGRALAPQGTMVHVYPLAALALLSATAAVAFVVRRHLPDRLLALVAVCIASVGFTFSRAGALALALVLATLAVGGARSDRRTRLAMVALVAGAAVPGVIWNDGWAARGGDTREGDVSTGRVVLMRQAKDLIAGEPAFGVGPGRYVIELRDRGVDPANTGGMLKPVHNLPLLVAAEAGVVAGALVVALLAVLGWRAWRAGPVALAVYLAYLPYTLLDHFPYSFPQGLVMTGVWIGVIEWLAGEHARAPATPPPAARA